MKRILVPTDFSDCAMNALKVAASIARKTNSAITLAHVYEVPIYGLSSAGGMQGLSYDGQALTRIKNTIKEELGKIAALDFLKGITLEKFVLAERSILDILEHPELKEVELIVMGSHGASGVKESFIGSNTEKVVRRSPYPVLTIKYDPDGMEMKNVVLASAFYGEADQAFHRLKKVTDIFQPVYHLLKVNTANRFEKTLVSEKLMRDFADKFNLKDYTINVFNDDTVEEGVIQFANAIDADLIAMPTHGRTGIGHLINGSITEGLVNHSAKPVLSVKIEEPKVEYGPYIPEK